METKTIQFTAGRGPAECTWVVAKVLKTFIKKLEENKFDYTILQKENGNQNGTVQSVTIQIEGKNLTSFLKEWLGTIKWIGTSTYRKHHKRKNWFIGCFELKMKNKTTVDEKQIAFQAIRSSGPGGQHVNKVSSAIRAKHIPTGIQVLVSESRSQHQNKKIAIQRLKERVMANTIEQLQQSVQQEWENHLNIERGNPVQIFTGTDFKIQKQKKKNYKSKRNQLKNDLRRELN
ncbi:peptide chain release factor H [Tenacibaculum jejuense]|uniref:Peptide chain release factor n=1 Tax=Tenacibaculum jejuense TaxID=584609 RepID=A0A238UA26_9FLAO|nr:peptide chain release factor H [Tenacibaculum jejuense]SNR15846.1 peptide chain release factor [Tenacibaculum jejuense]